MAAGHRADSPRWCGTAEEASRFRGNATVPCPRIRTPRPMTQQRSWDAAARSADHCARRNPDQRGLPIRRYLHQRLSPGARCWRHPYYLVPVIEVNRNGSKDPESIAVMGGGGTYCCDAAPAIAQGGATQSFRPRPGPANAATMFVAMVPNGSRASRSTFRRGPPATTRGGRMESSNSNTTRPTRPRRPSSAIFSS